MRFRRKTNDWRYWKKNVQRYNILDGIDLLPVNVRPWHPAPSHISKNEMKTSTSWHTGRRKRGHPGGATRADEQRRQCALMIESAMKKRRQDETTSGVRKTHADYRSMTRMYGDTLPEDAQSIYITSHGEVLADHHIYILIDLFFLIRLVVLLLIVPISILIALILVCTTDRPRPKIKYRRWNYLRRYFSGQSQIMTTTLSYTEFESDVRDRNIIFLNKKHIGTMIQSFFSMTVERDTLRVVEKFRIPVLRCDPVRWHDCDRMIGFFFIPSSSLYIIIQDINEYLPSSKICSYFAS